MGTNVQATIRVFAQKVKGQIVFDLQSNYKKAGKLKFKNPKKGDFFDMNFVIEPNAFGLSFPAKLEAFWVAETACPTTHNYHNEFEALKVFGGDRTLQVRNWNRVPCEYWYALNFNSTTDGPQHLDPIIVNLNSYEQAADPDLSPGHILAIALAAAGTLAALFGLKSLFGKRDRRRR